MTTMISGIKETAKEVYDKYGEYMLLSVNDNIQIGYTRSLKVDLFRKYTTYKIGHCNLLGHECDKSCYDVIPVLDLSLTGTFTVPIGLPIFI